MLLTLTLLLSAFRGPRPWPPAPSLQFLFFRGGASNRTTRSVERIVVCLHVRIQHRPAYKACEYHYVGPPRHSRNVARGNRGGTQQNLSSSRHAPLEFKAGISRLCLLRITTNASTSHSDAHVGAQILPKVAGRGSRVAGRGSSSGRRQELRGSLYRYRSKSRKGMTQNRSRRFRSGRY